MRSPFHGTLSFINQAAGGRGENKGTTPCNHPNESAGQKRGLAILVSHGLCPMVDAECMAGQALERRLAIRTHSNTVGIPVGRKR